MKYQLFLNRETDEQGRLVGFSGYQPGHKMDLVAAGDDLVYRNDDDELEWIYSRYNEDLPAGYHDRSLSVGDVVVLGAGSPGLRAYACTSDGWEKLEHFTFPVLFTLGDPIVCAECDAVIGLRVQGRGLVIEAHHRHTAGCPKVKRVMDECTRNAEIMRQHHENEP